MKIFRVALAALLGAPLLCAATPASAALVNFTLNFIASDFVELYYGSTPGGPYAQITGQMTFNFDNLSSFSATNSGLTVQNFSMPSNYDPSFLYYVDYDIIAFGNIFEDQNCVIDTSEDSFCAFIFNASTHPTIGPKFFYTHLQGSGSPVYVSTFTSSSIITGSGVPEPTTWAMMLLGVGAIGCALRSRRRMVPLHA